MSVAPPAVPVIDISALLDPDASDGQRRHPVGAIDTACRSVGFFAIAGHGIPSSLRDQLETSARRFFEQPDAHKRRIAMSVAGPAWRGWFPVGGELTSGVADLKEGLYIGTDHPPDHPRVVAGTPLHGPNLFPDEPADLGPTVEAWMHAMRPVADAVLSAMAVGLGLQPDWFPRNLTDRPTELFRIFHYPPSDVATAGQWGVGEHTDYGLLTLLAQDHHGGLQVRGLDDRWIDVDPDPSLLVCNLGDMLERLTGGRYRSTPHRVRNTSGASRLSFPYFFDPSWDATVPTMPAPDDDPPPRARWDGADVFGWTGTYGDYLTAKVAKVFPELFDDVRR